MTEKVILAVWVAVCAHILLSWFRAIRRGRRARRPETATSAPASGSLHPVSVIVPAWNEKGTIERNIAALRQVQYPCWEALIVAGGADGTHEAAVAAAVGDRRFRVIRRGPEPKNAALKKGIREAQHDILVLLDCDNIVEPGWLAALVQPIANGASVSVGHSYPNRITWVTLEEQMWNIHTYQVLKLSWIQGDRSIAIRRELLERIGGLPEHTYAREDWDIWARLGETGERVVFAEGAHLVTDRPATLAESWRHQVRWRRTHLAGMWEHRACLLKEPRSLFNQTYAYLMSAMMAAAIVVAPFILLIHPSLSSIVLSLFILFLAWFCGRQATVAGEVAAYTGDWRWALRAWMPALNTLLIMAASVVALVSPAKQTPLYKGPRHET